MLLSIVECSDYRKFEGKGVLGEIKKTPLIEFIGPVVHKNIALMRNLGASQSNGTWVFFKDQDCQVDAEKLVRTLEKYSDYDVVGGIYSNPRSYSYFSRVYHEIQRKWLLRGILSKDEVLPQTKHILGGAFAIKKSVLDEFGGFSEEIGWGAEETELLNRMLEKEKKIGVCYSLKVYHKNQIGLLGFLKRAWRQNFNLIYYINPPKQPSALKINYLRSVVTHWPGIALFFSVAKFAQSIAFIARLYKRV